MFGVCQTLSWRLWWTSYKQGLSWLVCGAGVGSGLWSWLQPDLLGGWPRASHSDYRLRGHLVQCLGYPGVHSLGTLPYPLWGLRVLKCKVGHWTDDLGACSNFNILQRYRDEEVPGRWVWCHPTRDLCSPPLILGGGVVESSPQKCFSNRCMEGRKVLGLP